MTKPAKSGAALGGSTLLILGVELRAVVAQALSLMLSPRLQAALSELWLLVIQVWMHAARPAPQRLGHHLVALAGSPWLRLDPP